MNIIITDIPLQRNNNTTVINNGGSTSSTSSGGSVAAQLNYLPLIAQSNASLITDGIIQLPTSLNALFGKVTGATATYIIDANGWIFRNSTKNVASISKDGELTVKQATIDNGTNKIDLTVNTDGNLLVSGSDMTDKPVIQSIIDGVYQDLLINPNGGNVSINTEYSEGYQLNVNGTLKTKDITINGGSHNNVLSTDAIDGSFKLNGEPLGARIYKIDELLSGTFSSEDISNSVNAYVGKNLLNRVTAIETTGSQPVFNGTGFVKVAGSVISYDNNSYSLSNHTHNQINGVLIGDTIWDGSWRKIMANGYNLAIQSGDGSHALQIGYNGSFQYDNQTIWHSGNFNPNGKLDYRTFGSAANSNTDQFINMNWNRFTGDANTLGLANTTGVYNISSASNVPSYYGTLLGFWNGDISTQLYLGYNGDMSWRKSIGTSYTGSVWRTVWDSVNFNPANYLPLTGGFLTGVLDSNSCIIAGTGQGFKNHSYQGGYNRIWSFGGGSEAYGIGYWQGANSSTGIDAIGFHFGDINNPLFYIKSNSEAIIKGDLSVGNSETPRTILTNNVCGYGGTGTLNLNPWGGSVLVSGGYSVIHSGNIGSQVTNSFKLYSSDSIYTYGSSNPYFGYLTYNGSSNRWRFAVSPATPANVEVNYSDVAGNANNADNATTSTRLTVADVRGEERQPTYFSSYRIQPFFSNTISGLDGNWKSGINVAGWDTGSYNSWQLIGGSTTASFGEWYFREGTSSFGTPKRIWHDGNLNPIPKLNGAVQENVWFTYGQPSNGTYSWVNAALTTNSIELVTSVNGVGGHPTLAFHTWGTGGAQLRMSNDNVLHIESAFANSARVAGNSGTSYFNYLDIYSRSDIGIYINGHGVVHDGNIGSKTVNAINNGGGYGIQSQNNGLYFNNAVCVREAVGYTGNSDANGAPRLGFHWGGVVASSISIATNGSFYFNNNPGTGREHIYCGNVNAATYYGNGSALTEITKIWAESHPTSYYLKNNWDGQYWQLTSNHPSPVNVGHSDQSTNSDTVDGVHMWRGSLASYNALSKDANTMYIII